MGVYTSRRKIAELLESSVASLRSLSNELEVEFETRKTGWIRTSPKRRRTEEKVEDTMVAVDSIIAEMRRAMEILQPRSAAKHGG